MSPLITYWLLGLLTVAVCVFAMWKGGPGERYAGVVILTSVVIERLIRVFLVQSVGAPTNMIISLTGDGLAALALLALALRFGSPWLGAVMLFYAAQFGVHAFYLIVPTANDLFRIVAIDITFAGIHLCLVAGTILAWRGRRSQAAGAGFAAAE